MPLDEQNENGDNNPCKYIIISDEGQQQAYERMIASKQKLIQVIDKQIKTRVDTLSIDNVKRVLNSQVAVDANNNNATIPPAEYTNSNTRLVNVKLSIECYVGDEEVVAFKQKIKQLEKSHNRVEIQAKDTFASSSEFEDLFSHLTPFKVNIRSQCRVACVDNEIEFKFDCVQELAHGLDKCLSHLILNANSNNNGSGGSSKMRRVDFQSLDVNALEMQVGNLVTPFLFVTTNASSLGGVAKNVKTKIDFSEKTIEVIEDDYKYEISFNAIDQIICCDDRGDHMHVYIPMKRFPIIYETTLDDYYGAEILSFVDDLMIPR
jgi:hypothetical protein